MVRDEFDGLLDNGRIDKLGRLFCNEAHQIYLLLSENHGVWELFCYHHCRAMYTLGTHSTQAEAYMAYDVFLEAFKRQRRQGLRPRQILKDMGVF